MYIGPAGLLHENGRVILRSPVEWAGRKSWLWFSFDSRFEPYLGHGRLDGFLTGLLPTAMNLGEDIDLDGAISEKLFYNMTNLVLPVLNHAFPEWKIITLRPRELDDGRSFSRARGVGTGFSGGVDSFSTWYTHRRSGTPAAYRLTHLVFGNVGSHGDHDGEKARQLFNARFGLIRGFADEAGAELVRMDSNLHELAGLDFYYSHSLRNAAAPLHLQPLLGKYLYSSAFHFRDCAAQHGKAIGALDPVLVPHLSTETLEFVSSGIQYTRVEKTRQTVQIDLSRQYLNVCVSPGPDGRNCSICDKCARTMLTLELLQSLEKYSRVFDFRRYRRVRTAYLAFLLVARKTDPYAREILAAMHREKRRLPAKSRLLALPFLALPGRWKKKVYKLLLRLLAACGRIPPREGSHA